MNIYVGNLPKNTTEEAVRTVFSEFGQVTDIKLIKDHFTGELRGFAFVEMPSRDDAQKAITALNGADFEGRSLLVNEAKPRQERKDSGRRSRSW